MTEIFWLLPRKYQTIGHALVWTGGFIIIVVGMILTPTVYHILGHCCLITGILGTYFRKIKKFRSVRKSEEKERIEQKSLNGINRKFLLQKYVFYIITIVGIVFILNFEIPYQWRFIQGWMDYEGVLHLESLLSSIGFYLMGYLPFIGGLLILYFKKRREYWRPVETPQIPPQCKDCLWIKDGKCFYDGDEYDDWSDDFTEGNLAECHSKIEGFESVD